MQRVTDKMASSELVPQTSSELVPQTSSRSMYTYKCTDCTEVTQRSTPRMYPESKLLVCYECIKKRPYVNYMCQKCEMKFTQPAGMRILFCGKCYITIGKENIKEEEPETLAKSMTPPLGWIVYINGLQCVVIRRGEGEVWCTVQKDYKYKSCSGQVPGIYPLSYFQSQTPGVYFTVTEIKFDEFKCELKSTCTDCKEQLEIKGKSFCKLCRPNLY